MSQPEQGPDTPQTALPWPAERHEAYLDSRPDATTAYNPAAEYGDADWREPASDAEAAARTAWLAENTPPAPGWPSRQLTEVENALEDAQERAVLADRAHDPDPYAWAEYQRLQALDRLAPLPAHDALDDLPRDEHAAPDTLAATWRNEDQSVRDHRADAAPLDPEPLRERIELRASLAAEAQESIRDDEQRREQLARWHYDDNRTPTDTDLDSGQDADSGHSGQGSTDKLGWGR